MRDPVTMFLCGDVMVGRGIDQVLPRPCAPTLHEPYVTSSRVYVRIAEDTHGPIPRPVSLGYVWGDAAAVFDHFDPRCRLVNLETAVTRSEDYWKLKSIHYRISPENARCLHAAHISACSLANNHVLDWGYDGLSDTLRVLDEMGMGRAGAGAHETEARAPCIAGSGPPQRSHGKSETPPSGRLLLFAGGSVTSGIPASWAADRSKPGINLIPDYSPRTVRNIADDIFRVKRAGDIVVYSIHWGGNWGFDISSRERSFAHALIDTAGVDVVHGHSSHHVKGLEVYHKKLILYGCGDLINDYEGIGGHRPFRGDLGLMYFPRIDPVNGKLVDLSMVPMTMRRFRLTRVNEEGATWLESTLNRAGRSLGTRVRLAGDGTLTLETG